MLELGFLKQERKPLQSLRKDHYFSHCRYKINLSGIFVLRKFQYFHWISSKAHSVLSCSQFLPRTFRDSSKFITC